MSTPQPGRELSRFQIRRQPNDTTCGPTCLHAMYRFFGEDVALDDLLGQVRSLEGGGTLAVLLGTHARLRGYGVKLITWNLRIFDPTWFEVGRNDLRDRLQRRAIARGGDAKLTLATHAYIDFLDAGGEIAFADLTPKLLRQQIEQGLPILTGLSSTFLYREARERLFDGEPDDIAGDPVGHFVVLTGYDAERDEVLVSDPMHPNPLAEKHTYPVSVERVIGAIYLGVLTFDGNLIVLTPEEA